MTEAPARRGPVAEAIYLSAVLIKHRALAIRRDWKSRSLYGFAVTLGLGVFCTILLGSFGAVRVLLAASAYGLLDSIPAWAFLIYLFTDVLIAFGQALGDLYLSRDMPILLSMPLRISSIIAAKFALGVAQNEVYAVVFLLPFAVGYLLGIGAAWWTIPIAAAAVFVFPATLYAVLLVVTIAALRVIPPKVAKEGLWLIGASVPTVFWFLSFYRIAHVAGEVATMRLPTPPDWLPSTWVGNALAMLGAGDIEAAASWLWLLAVATFLVCPLALAFVANGFARGWSGAVTAPARRVAASASVAKAHTPIFALSVKDLKTFVRSPQLWFNHIAALGFIGYLFVGHSVQTPLFPLTTQLAMLQIGFAAVLGAINPGMTAISLEHRAIWLLRSGPFSALDILRSKFRVAYLQTGIVAAVGASALAYGYGFTPAQTALLVVFGLIASASSVCTGIAFDAAHPSFDWDNPNQINRGLRMIVPFSVNFAMLTGCAILLYGLKGLMPGPAALAAGFVACATLQAGVAMSALRYAHRDIEALEV